MGGNHVGLRLFNSKNFQCKNSPKLYFVKDTLSVI